MTLPDFSVVIPVFNRPEDVRACLERFVSPESEGVEVIVVDDGSSDDTPDVVEEIAATSRGAAISLLRQANSGPGPARNLGAKAARGQWVIFHDSDDLWLPWTIPTLRAVLGRPEAQDAAVLFLEVERFLDPCALASLTPGELELREHATVLDMRLDDPLSLVGSCNVGFRRDVFLAVEGFTGLVRHSEDTDLFYRAGDRGPVLVIAAPAMMGYRLSDPSRASQTNSGDAIRNRRTRFLIERNRAGLYPGPHRKRAEALSRTVAYTVREYFAEGRVAPAYRVWWQGRREFLAAGQWGLFVKLPLTPFLHYIRPGRYAFRWSPGGV